MNKEEEKMLREYLWLSHGHEGLYGDDGEMQCGLCLADYKRGNLGDLIRKAIDARIQVNLLKFARMIKWEKVFEDEITIDCDDDGTESIELTKKSVVELFEKYLMDGHYDVSYHPVKIKARKGAILIERLKD